MDPVQISVVKIISVISRQNIIFSVELVDFITFAFPPI
jgi:hypothetical protein